MAECIQCGNHTMNVGERCVQCQNNQNSTEVVDNIVEKKAKGLKPKDYTKHYRMVKGKMAETLIKQLFESQGYKVFSSGVENMIPGIIELLKGVRSDIAKEIRRMPDFVVQHPKTNSVYFIEVKFRANGKFKAKNLLDSYPYENAYIILVSKKHIKCISVDELNKGKEITPTSRNYLGSQKEFGLDRDAIITFCSFAKKFFENV